MDLLSFSLNKLLDSIIKCFSVSRGCPRITRLSYEDDILIFSSACPTSLQLVMQTNGSYEAMSGQQINVQKSCFLVHDKLLRYRAAIVQRVTGFVHKPFSCVIFGLSVIFWEGEKNLFHGNGTVCNQ